MSATVTYKGNAITTVDNTTKKLNTKGKYLEDDITITDSTSGGTAAISVVDTTDSHGGTVRTITALDISDTTTVASDVRQGKYFYTAQGVKTAGTASGGGGGATQHEIHLEFTDSTDTDIEVDYNDSWVGNLITSTKPKTYGLKEVLYAQLDGVTWYEATIIPLNTELVDFTKIFSNTAIGDQGEAFSQEWSYATDYTAVAPDMTFSYTAYTWFYIGLYDESKTMIRTIYGYDDGTPDPNDGNTVHGTLSSLPSIVAYVRLCGTAPNSSKISLIRTA